MGTVCGASSRLRPSIRWAVLQLATLPVAIFFVVFTLWPVAAPAQVPNFHPCNAQPALPICKYGYGKRIAIRRWGALPEPQDPDASVQASLVTDSPAAEIEKLKAHSALVQDADTLDILFARNADEVRPVASITKLMAALVIVDAGLSMEDIITIRESDRQSASEMPPRLPAGANLTRHDLLHLALVASENTAAKALARTFPGGMEAFVEAMNRKAGNIGMKDARFVEPTGISEGNVSSARDLVRLVQAVSQRPLLRKISTEAKYQAAGRSFRNTNMLVGRPQWQILVSKTGTTRLAGDCLVMMVTLEGRNLAIVVLNAQGKNGSRFGDAVRLRRIVSSGMNAETVAAWPSQ